MRGRLDGDKLNRHDVCALVQHLKIGVLPIRAWLAPQHRRGGVRQRVTRGIDAFAIAFHFELLQIGRQTAQGAVIRRDGAAGETQEIAVPDVQQAQTNRQVLLQRRGAEVFVHRVRACEEVAETLGTYRYCQRQADRRPHRITPAHPVPKTKSAADAEFSGGGDVGCQCGEVACGVRAAVGREPGFRGGRVGHRLNRREGLAGN